MKENCTPHYFFGGLVALWSNLAVAQCLSGQSLLKPDKGVWVMPRIIAFILVMGCSFALSAQQLNTNFADNGVLRVNFEDNFYILDVAASPRDKFFVIGYNCEDQTLTSCQPILHIHSYLNSGEINPDFGNGGKLQVSIADTVFLATLDVLPGEDLLITFYDGFFRSNAVVYKTRILKTGVVDTAYANNGVLSYPGKAPGAKVVCSNSFMDGSHFALVVDETYHREIICYDASGEIHTAFGNQGKVTLPLFSQTMQSHDFNLAVDSSQQAFYLSSYFDWSPPNVKVTYQLEKIDSDGTYAESFGNNGVVVVNDTLYPFPFAFEPAPPSGAPEITLHDDKLYLSGTASKLKEDNQQSHWGLVSLKSDGSIASDFGQEGVLLDPYGRFTTLFVGDFFYTFGGYTAPGEQYNGDFQIHKYALDGGLVPEFGIDGTYELDIEENRSEQAFDGLVLEDNTLLAYGINFTSSYGGVIISLDPTSTNITDIELSAGQSIFPNPAQNTLHLPQELSSQNLKLHNIQGQQFEVVQPSAGKLDVSHLAPGIYVLQARERIWRFEKE